jgi:hypothetical protein
MELQVLSPAVYEKVIFGKLSVCVRMDVPLDGAQTVGWLLFTFGIYEFIPY